MNQSQITELLLESTTSSSILKSIIAGTQKVQGNYGIGATLCMPPDQTKPDSVQFLTHGLGFDRTYWDFGLGYSFADTATHNGHAAFFYDRLGVGSSDTPDPLNVVQAPLELEIANELIAMLRGGHFGGVKFCKVLGVGHSFGSVLTEAVTAAYPSSLDAAILTGYSVNSTGYPSFLSGQNLAIASELQPYRFNDLENAYLVSSTAIATQIGFFHAPGFDPIIFSKADSSKSTITIGELFSSSVIAAPATNFTGPVAVVNGADDLPFCAGNCSYPTNLLAGVKALYPGVATSKFGTYVASNAGHALNFHYSAAKAYQYIQTFVKQHEV